ncbi:MFS transporter [Caulobacter vibrioides]|uniref:MFS transporter n=1 Tax=Caulobacter TaxID=75 RepID=UPI000BB50739|nr:MULTISPECIES: MFS transporter [Caulobacter]ATC24519.1 MFS transporter [Caulobacter vibrioides]AZH12669.1 MFS transporter [Caulobacter vibrioides]MCY1647518.1 MFS transporter [Caulobacter sp. SL161]PLR15104.1 MFS transporter [Caulobacter vibrioides]
MGKEAKSMDVPKAPEPSEKIGRYRWIIVTLLFLAMVINYVDRQTIGFLKTDLSKEFGWSESDYANLVFYFQLSYAVAYLVWGKIMDKIGARWGFGIAFLIWQVAHIAHAGARGLTGFIFARMALGVGEAGGFPGGIKAVTEWFPKKERAFATGIFNAGTNIGAIVTPLVVPAIVLAWGWQMAFIVTGVAGLIWLPIWLLVYRTPRETKNLSAAELAHIEQDPADPVEKIAWTKLLTKRETWAYAIGKFLIDPIWWMFLFWLPDFLGKRYGLDLKTFGPPIVAIYLLSDVGSVGGGWLSSNFMKMGWSINKARKITMLICALLAVPVMFASFADSLWVAVLIIGVATAAHQGFSANLYTLPSDVFPRGAVGSVVGIGGMLGAVGGMVFSKYIGGVLESIGTYTPIFIVAGSAYLLALLVVHLLTPKMEPVKI